MNALIGAIAGSKFFIVIDKNGNLKTITDIQDVKPGEVLLTKGEDPMTSDTAIQAELVEEDGNRVPIAVQDEIDQIFEQLADGQDPTLLDEEFAPAAGLSEGSSTTPMAVVVRDAVEIMASTSFDTTGIESQGLSRTQSLQLLQQFINQAPTVTLSNFVDSLDENTPTDGTIRVADIDITDDQQGVNELSLSGADADNFIIVELADGSHELHLKAGVTLDFETLSSMDVSVDVKDLTLSQNVLDTDSMTLDINDLGEEPVISGAVSGGVIEDDYDDGEQGVSVVGTLSVVDPDAGESGFAAQEPIGGDYGLFTFDNETGQWTYVLNNEDANVQGLEAEQQVTETFTVTTLDGTSQTVTVVVTGTSDTPTAEEFAVGADESFTFDQHTSDAEDDFNGVETSVVIEEGNLPKYGQLVDNNGDPLVAGPDGNIIVSDTQSITYEAFDQTEVNDQFSIDASEYVQNLDSNVISGDVPVNSEDNGSISLNSGVVISAGVFGENGTTEAADLYYDDRKGEKGFGVNNKEIDVTKDEFINVDYSGIDEAVDVKSVELSFGSIWGNYEGDPANAMPGSDDYDGHRAQGQILVWVEFDGEGYGEPIILDDDQLVNLYNGTGEFSYTVTAGEGQEITGIRVSTSAGIDPSTGEEGIGNSNIVFQGADVVATEITDSFNYVAKDSQGNVSEEETVYIDGNSESPVIDPTVVQSINAVDDAYLVTSPLTANPADPFVLQEDANRTDRRQETNSEYEIKVADLLGNDVTSAGSLTLVAVSNATHGRVSLVENDQGEVIAVKFTPARNYNGEASFEYTIRDENGSEDTATTTLWVEPVADAGSVTVNAITDDDVINIAESETTADSQTPIMVSGTARGGDIQSGDSVSMVINSKTYETTVDENGNWSVAVDGADLAVDQEFTVNVTSIDGISSVVSSRDSEHAVDLVAPGAPVVVIQDGEQDLDEQGYINAQDAAVDGGVKVHVTLPDGVEAGDIVNLTISSSADGVADVTVPYTVLAENIADNAAPVSFDIPAEMVTDNATLTASAMITDTAGNESATGSDNTIVDLTIPGGPDGDGDTLGDNAPLVVIQDGEQDLDEQGYINAQDAAVDGGVKVHVTLPDGVEAGDIVNLTISSSADGVADVTVPYTVLAENIADNAAPVSFDIPAEMVTDNATLTASAMITDTAGNESATGSDNTIVDLTIPGGPDGDGDTLGDNAPLVVIQDGEQDLDEQGYINAQDAAVDGGVKVHVTLPDGVEAGDIVNLTISSSADGVADVTVPYTVLAENIADNAAPVSFDIPAEMVTDNATLTASAMITDTAGNESATGSDNTIVDLTIPGGPDGDGDTLGDNAPLVVIQDGEQDLDEQGYINAQDAAVDGGVKVHVTLPDGVEAGDIVNLTISSSADGVADVTVPYTVLAENIADNAAPVSFDIPAEMVTDNATLTASAMITDTAGNESATGSDNTIVDLTIPGGPDGDGDTLGDNAPLVVIQDGEQDLDEQGYINAQDAAVDGGVKVHVTLPDGVEAGDIVNLTISSSADGVADVTVPYTVLAENIADNAAPVSFDIPAEMVTDNATLTASAMITDTAGNESATGSDNTIVDLTIPGGPDGDGDTLGDNAPLVVIQDGEQDLDEQGYINAQDAAVDGGVKVHVTLPDGVEAGDIVNLTISSSADGVADVTVPYTVLAENIADNAAPVSFDIPAEMVTDNATLTASAMITDTAGNESATGSDNTIVDLTIPGGPDGDGDTLGDNAPLVVIQDGEQDLDEQGYINAQDAAVDGGVKVHVTLPDGVEAGDIVNLTISSSADGVADVTVPYTVLAENIADNAAPVSFDIPAEMVTDNATLTASAMITDTAGNESATGSDNTIVDLTIPGGPDGDGDTLGDNAPLVVIQDGEQDLDEQGYINAQDAAVDGGVKVHVTLPDGVEAGDIVNLTISSSADGVADVTVPYTVLAENIADNAAPVSFDIPAEMVTDNATLTASAMITDTAGNESATGSDNTIVDLTIPGGPDGDGDTLGDNAPLVVIQDGEQDLDEQGYINAQDAAVDGGVKVHVTLPDGVEAGDIVNLTISSSADGVADVTVPYTVLAENIADNAAPVSFDIPAEMVTDNATLTASAMITDTAGNESATGSDNTIVDLTIPGGPDGDGDTLGDNAPLVVIQDGEQDLDEQGYINAEDAKGEISVNITLPDGVNSDTDSLVVNINGTDQTIKLSDVTITAGGVVNVVIPAVLIVDGETITVDAYAIDPAGNRSETGSDNTIVDLTIPGGPDGDGDTLGDNAPLVVIQDGEQDLDEQGYINAEDAKGEISVNITLPDGVKSDTDSLVVNINGTDQTIKLSDVTITAGGVINVVIPAVLIVDGETITVDAYAIDPAGNRSETGTDNTIVDLTIPGGPDGDGDTLGDNAPLVVIQDGEQDLDEQGYINAQDAKGEISVNITLPDGVNSDTDSLVVNINGTDQTIKLSDVTITAGGVVNVVIPAVLIVDGETITVDAYAIDPAGNRSETGSDNTIVDLTIPGGPDGDGDTLGDNAPLVVIQDGEQDLDEQGYINAQDAKGEISVNITLPDGVKSDTDSLVVNINGTDQTIKLSDVTITAGGVVNVVIPAVLIVDGETITVDAYAIDPAGNRSETGTDNTIVDLTIPGGPDGDGDTLGDNAPLVVIQDGEQDLDEQGYINAEDAKGEISVNITLPDGVNSDTDSLVVNINGTDQTIKLSDVTITAGGVVNVVIPAVLIVDGETITVDAYAIDPAGNRSETGSDNSIVDLFVPPVNVGPIATDDFNNTIFTETFEDGHNITGNTWGVIDNYNGWDTSVNGVEIQSGSVGGSTASEGEAHAELDAHNIVTMSRSLDTPDSEYQLVFDYKPRPGHEADSDMEVTFAGQTVQIHSDAQGNLSFISDDGAEVSLSATLSNGWSTVSITFNTPADSSQLSFTGLGVSNSLGAYIDNIRVSEGFDTNENNAIDFTASQLLLNDSDIDGDTLSIINVSEVENGTVTLVKDSVTGDVTSISFTPSDNYSGPASFQYEVSDGNGGTDTATVYINVAPVNDAPIANDDGPIAVTEDTLAIGNVLTNDTDVDNAHSDLKVTEFSFDGKAGTVGQALSIAGVGELTINDDGSFEFMPELNYTGPVPSAQYTVSDGLVAAQTQGTLSFADISPVNDAPTAQDFTVVADAGKEVAFSFDGGQNGTQNNVTDEEDDSTGGDTQVIIDSVPQHGTLFLANSDVPIAKDQQIDDISQVRYVANSSGDILDSLSFTASAGLLSHLSDNNGSMGGYVDGADSVTEAKVRITSGRLDEQSTSLTYDSGNNESGFGVDSGAEGGSNELDVQEPEYIKVDYSESGAQVNSVAIEFGSLWGHYNESDINNPDSNDPNAQINVIVTMVDGDGNIVTRVEDYNDATNPDVYTGSGNFEAIITADNGYSIQSLQIYTTSSTQSSINSNMLVNSVEVLDAQANETIEYHAIDAQGLAGNTAEVTFVVNTDPTLYIGDNGTNNIDGSISNDVIIGDLGGVETRVVLEADDYNIALLVDVSGSMGDYFEGSSGPTKLEAVQDKLADLIESIKDHPGTINVTLIPFGGDVGAIESVAGLSESNFAAFNTAIDALTSDGGTNYVSAFVAATNYFTGLDTPDAKNLTFFLSDGEPTMVTPADNSGGTTEPRDISEAITAFSALSAISDVKAIGVGDDISVETLRHFDNTGTEDVTLGLGDLSFYGDAIMNDGVLKLAGNNKSTTSEEIVVSGGADISFELSHITGNGSSTWSLIDTSTNEVVKSQTVVTQNGVEKDNITVSIPNLSAGTYKLELVNNRGGQINLMNLAVVLAGLGQVNIVTGNDGLELALNTGVTELTEIAVSSDTLYGHEGNDIIFGDVLNTDNLDWLGITGVEKPADGSGIEALETYLEAPNGTAPTESEVYDFIKANEELLYVDSDPRGDSDTIYGGEGDDTLYGQGGADKLYGEEGNDTLYGGEGDDFLDGGLGNDILTGGDGADTFIWSTDTIDSGTDIITDFHLNSDKIDLTDLLESNTQADSIDDILSSVTVDGDNVKIQFNEQASSQTIVLEHGVSALELDSSIYTDGSTIDLTSELLAKVFTYDG
ncbi:tandem-95 repeat protein [Vibrio sp. VB16]|uniref:tandem-95 repeat protein n=1 Tax=Vibrio sp. VB16 TaxID=2785746 RepID=UPI00189D1660|nr:cadherin-like domain-containing protein [Vibrio sp. VB16]UGA56272.1 cadherin-like domain-containing protein [Vibrio sp. VB16]